MMERNPQIDLAERYVRETGMSLFLTGKAGTGKTTFLRHIAEHCPKRHVVVAPTGVAAVNAGGVTIHSFFQLPFCPYLPDIPELVTEYQMPEQQRQLRKSKIDIIRTLELLIIDEISMVRADLLDAVDATLRRYRHNSRPFGGVQLLMIGDVQQLAPVVTEEERPYMERVYPSPFFFHSKALQRLRYITIQLTTIYRLRKAYDAWIFRAAPYMRLEEGAWKLKLGLAVSVGLEDNEPDAAIFPDIHANLDIVPEILSVYAGADGGMRRDAFQTLSRENPYLAPMLDLKTDKLYRLFAGTKTNLSNSLVFGARIGMEMHSALSCYIPDTTPVAWRDTTAIRLFNTFGIQHTKTSLTNLHMDVTYHYRESLRISSNLDYYSYSTPDSVTLYYKPQYSIGISAAYLWKDKIRIGTDIAWKGGAFAPEYTADGSYGKVSLPDWFDWSLNAEYLWNRRLRFFAEFNNLTGRRNQLYAGYYTERFNCLFGLKYLFGGE